MRVSGKTYPPPPSPALDFVVGQGIGLPIYDFLLMIKTNKKELNRLLGHLEFDLSRSLEVKCDCIIVLTIYDFLLLCNSNIWPKFDSFIRYKASNLNDLDLTFQGDSSSKVALPLDSPYMLSY